MYAVIVITNSMMSTFCPFFCVILDFKVQIEWICQHGKPVSQHVNESTCMTLEIAWYCHKSALFAEHLKILRYSWACSFVRSEKGERYFQANQWGKILIDFIMIWNLNKMNCGWNELKGNTLSNHREGDKTPTHLQWRWILCSHVNRSIPMTTGQTQSTNKDCITVLSKLWKKT